MQETWVQFLGQEDPLEKKMVTHSGILAWEIPWTEEPDGLQFMGLQRVGHDRATNIFTHKEKERERKRKRERQTKTDREKESINGYITIYLVFPHNSVSKESACNTGIRL